MQFWNLALPVLSGSFGVRMGGVTHPECFTPGLKELALQAAILLMRFRPMPRDRGSVPGSPLSQGATPAPANARTQPRTALPGRG